MTEFIGYINNGVYLCKRKQNLLSVLTKNGINIDACCGGNANCGKCKVKAWGELSALSKDEQSLLSEKEIQENIRLACKCFVEGDFYCETEELVFEIESNFGELCIERDLPSNLKNYLSQNINTIAVGIDIGTTTIAAAFFSVKTQTLLYTATAVNPQKSYGADVLSRISHSIKNSSAGEMQKAVINKINLMCKEFCDNNGTMLSDIKAFSITGNTTMLLLAAGYDIKSLGSLPFIPESYLDETKNSSDIGLSATDAEVYFMPAVSAFFGGDAVAAMLATGFGEGKKVKFLADIGTNGEMALGCGNTIYVCSTAAGPAFEGAEIRFGTATKKGALKHCFKDNNGRLVYNTIGDIAPDGICGTGLVDICAYLLDENILETTGRLNIESIFEGEPSFRITGSDIWLTQSDIRKLQQAKAALCAGAIVLKKQSPFKIEEVFIAGGFGAEIDIKNAARIGLFPEDICNKAVAVGNAALKGAIMVLFSNKAREKARQIAKTSKVIELAFSSDFNNEYINNMMFGIDDE